MQGLEERYLDVFQENLGLQDAIKSGEGLDKLEETSYFMRQRAQLQKTAKELETTQSKYIALTTSNADLEHRFQAAQTGDSNANVEALQQNKERQQYLMRIEQDLQEYKSLLQHALSRSLDHVGGDIRESNEYKLIRHQVASVREAPSEDAQSVVENTSARLADKQVKSLKDLHELKKVGRHASWYWLFTDCLCYSSPRIKRPRFDPFSSSLSRRRMSLPATPW